MSTLIKRTNPDKIPQARGAGWRCCACAEPYETETEARTCAETDHATGRHKAPSAPRYQSGEAA